MNVFCRMSACLGFLLLSATTFGAVPLTLHYQGYLTNDSGEPVHCPDVATCPLKSIVFSLYKSKDSLEAVWKESYSNVAVVHGTFNIELGSKIPLGPELLADGMAFLGIAIDGGDDLEPRQVIVSAAYAIYAGSADHAADADSLGGVDAGDYTTAEEVATICVTPEALAEQAFCTECYTDADVAAYLAANGYPGALESLNVGNDGTLSFNDVPVIDAR